LEKTNSESHNHLPESARGIQWGKTRVQHFAGCSFPQVCTGFTCWLADTQGKVTAAVFHCLPSYGCVVWGSPQRTCMGNGPSGLWPPPVDPWGQQNLVSFYPIGPAA